MTLLDWVNCYRGDFLGYLARPLSRATLENIFAFANKYGLLSSCFTVGVSRCDQFVAATEPGVLKRSVWAKTS